MSSGRSDITLLTLLSWFSARQRWPMKEFILSIKPSKSFLMRNNNHNLNCQNLPLIHQVRDWFSNLHKISQISRILHILQYVNGLCIQCSYFRHSDSIIKIEDNDMHIRLFCSGVFEIFWNRNLLSLLTLWLVFLISKYQRILKNEMTNFRSRTINIFTHRN